MSISSIRSRASIGRTISRLALICSSAAHLFDPNNPGVPVAAAAAASSDSKAFITIAFELSG